MRGQGSDHIPTSLIPIHFALIISTSHPYANEFFGIFSLTKNKFIIN